jgi:GTPase SAR1 family protein
MVFDLRLKDNFKVFIAGPSGCGKTTFIINLIKNIDNIAQTPPNKVIYFFKEWQSKFEYMKYELNVDFIEDNDMIIDQIREYEGSSALVIFDDMINSSNLNQVAQLFTVHGRHLNLCLAFLSQRLFNNNEYFRQISQNSDYFCVFKNPRNFLEIRSLAMQITPSRLELQQIFKKATNKPYSYIFINLTQECIPQLKFISDIFNQDHVIKVFVISNCK